MARSLQLKKALDGVERWFDEKGPAGQSFRESLEAGGVLVEDLKVVAGAVTGLLHSGLTRAAVIALLQGLLPRDRNGRPYPSTTLNEVLDAMAKLHTYVEPKGVKP